MEVGSMKAKCNRDCLNCTFPQCIEDRPQKTFKTYIAKSRKASDTAAYKKKYYENNKEKVRECQRKYLEKNREKIREYQREYREKNREKNS
jgi:hypothetical protein